MRKPIHVIDSIYSELKVIIRNLGESINENSHFKKRIIYEELQEFAKSIGGLLSDKNFTCADDKQVMSQMIGEISSFLYAANRKINSIEKQLKFGKNKDRGGERVLSLAYCSDENDEFETKILEYSKTMLVREKNSLEKRLTNLK